VGAAGDGDEAPAEEDQGLPGEPDQPDLAHPPGDVA
jgi:hypothetical protein